MAFKVRLSHVTSMNVDLTDYDACSFMDPKLNVKFGLGTGPDVHDRNL